MNHKPLFFNDANAIAVPLKIKKGIKNNNNPFKIRLKVNAPLRKDSGKIA
jgi:hypothetical protein